MINRLAICYKIKCHLLGSVGYSCWWEHTGNSVPPCFQTSFRWITMFIFMGLHFRGKIYWMVSFHLANAQYQVRISELHTCFRSLPQKILKPLDRNNRWVISFIEGEVSNLYLPSIGLISVCVKNMCYRRKKTNILSLILFAAVKSACWK